MRATFDQDIEAGRGPADAEQYGRPQYTDEVNESAGMPMDARTPTPPISTPNHEYAIPVDESAGLNTGAIPVDESAGLDTSATPQQEGGSYGPLAGADFDPRHVPANAMRIIQYLRGADAAPPQVADKFKQGVQAEHPGISEDDANLVAVHKAGEAGGDDAAHQMVQYNRMAYNAKQSFAAAALKGVQGKPPDMQVAANAATQASHHVLDGSQAMFVASPSGVTATVKMPGTNSRVSYNLTPQQFSDYLDVGGNGQWDKLMEQGGIPAALQKIAGTSASRTAGSGGQQTAQARDDRGTQDQDAPLLRQDQQPGGYDPNQPEGPGGQYQGEDDGRVKPAPGTMFNPPRNRAARKGEPGYSEAAHLGHDIVHSLDAPINEMGHNQPGYYPGLGGEPGIRGQHDENGHWLGPKTTSKTNFDPDLEARADQMFGRGRVADPRRTQWMSEQESQQADRENKKDIETIRTGGRVEASKNRANSYQYAADQKYKSAVAQLDAKTQQALNASNMKAAQLAQSEHDATMREVGRAVRKRQDAMIMAGETVTPEKINKIWQEEQQRSYAQPGATPPAAAPQTGAPKQQAPARQLSAQDQQAIAWANAHPGDPRAAKIKQLHGM